MPTLPKILPNEKELFALMATGSEKAFTEIFYHYSDKLYSHIFSKIGSHDYTEEVVQEVFIKIWNRRSKFLEVENYESYLLSMATNGTYDFLRKMASDEKLKISILASMEPYSNITTETLDLKYSQEALSKAVDQLPPQQKKIFLLSRQEGLTRFEIAEQLQISPSTVNNHLTVALSSIKKYLQTTPAASYALLMILMRIHNN